VACLQLQQVADVECTCAALQENCGFMSGDCSRSENVCSKCVSHFQ
jgi:hypothetical protein